MARREGCLGRSGTRVAFLGQRDGWGIAFWALFSNDLRIGAWRFFGEHFSAIPPVLVLPSSRFFPDGASERQIPPLLSLRLVVRHDCRAKRAAPPAARPLQRRRIEPVLPR